MNQFVKGIAVALLVVSAIAAVIGFFAMISSIGGLGGDEAVGQGLALIAGALTCSLFSGVGWIIADVAPRLTAQKGQGTPL